MVRKAKGEFFPFPLPISRRKNAARGRGSLHDGFTQTEVDEFWLKWDQLAKQRQDLFDKGNVDWFQIARLLTASNLLMRNAPDRRLRRIARLSRLPPDLDLMCPDCIIYYICGPHPPYIGQCGAINGPRPPLERFCEHCRKGRSLKTKYVGRQCRSHVRAVRLGRIPSLPRLIARYGMGCMTMYHVERVDP